MIDSLSFFAVNVVQRKLYKYILLTFCVKMFNLNSEIEIIKKRHYKMILNNQ